MRFLFALVPLLLTAQEVRVYSEFTRIDPFGSVVPPDRGVPPREILSPAVARNGYASFRVAVEAPPGTEYRLYIGLNPEQAVDVTLYRETYAQVGSTWFPVRLEKVEEPYLGRIPQNDPILPGQTTQTFWLDLHVAKSAPVRRIKVEPQLSIGDRWITYPMEIRVISTILPASGRTPALHPGAPNDPSDWPARHLLRDHLCGSRATAADPPTHELWQKISRNAVQDLRLLASLKARLPRETLFDRIRSASGISGPFCEASLAPAPNGPEWLLRVRDTLYGNAETTSPVVR